MNAQQILDRIDLLDNQIAALNRYIAADNVRLDATTDLEYKKLLTQGINKKQEILDRCVAQLGSLRGNSSSSSM